ncbi:MAG: hypothetical protein CMH48_09930 [Muricauda sp.]|nr:fibronectin type III domain-containing protein [Allomuricauda sp.]MAU15624.1 hypothetical protein [Allomuricauda sp.]MBC31153.1 hypothetical protein [Allomuricauda sp.]|tara:strand:+ start:57878 stop:59146 length:1269 start_codon:yes stop_codon:yes gene_type:complete
MKSTYKVCSFLTVAFFSFCIVYGAEHEKKTLTATLDNNNLDDLSPWFAQIWSEDFSGLPDGATSDIGATAWTSLRLDDRGTFQVQGGLMFYQGQNGGSNATWTSEDVDISNYSNISISYLVGDALDGEKETNDYVRGYYVLDNGSRVQFSEVTDDVPIPVVQSIDGLNGNTLRIEIDFRVSYGNETYTIDNVLVEGTSLGDTQAPSPPTLTSSGQSDTTVDLSWSGATDNIGVTSYAVFQDNVEIQNNITTTTYQVTGLAPSTSYSFKARAYDAAGNESVDSNVHTISTDAGSGGTGGSSVWTESNTTASYSGEVAIGRSTVPSGYKLAVEGHVRAREMRVDQDTWPDYVFEKNYRLPSLEEIKKHIEEKGHLPNIPSAEEIQANGLELGEMNKRLLEKIEELTLYILQQEERIKILEKHNN